MSALIASFGLIQLILKLLFIIYLIEIKMKTFNIKFILNHYLK